jgi:hypothetical protein
MDWKKSALITIILINIVIFGYLMIYFPYRCNQIALLSAGTSTCGLNIGAYLIAIGNCIVAAVAALFMIKE